MKRTWRNLFGLLKPNASRRRARTATGGDSTMPIAATSGGSDCGGDGGGCGD